LSAGTLVPSQWTSDWVRTADHIAQFSLTATLHIAAWITASPNWALRHEFSSLLRCLPRHTLACILPLRLAVSFPPPRKTRLPLHQKICTHFLFLESCQTWTILAFILFKTALIYIIMQGKIHSVSNYSNPMKRSLKDIASRLLVSKFQWKWKCLCSLSVTQRPCDTV